MQRTIDAFQVELIVRHPSLMPSEISKALGKEPEVSLAAGQVVAGIQKKSSFWAGVLYRSARNEEFTNALIETLRFIEQAESFLTSVTESGGETELVINQTVGMDDGILLKLSLQPEVLSQLGRHSIALRVQAWSAEQSTDSPS